MCTFRTLTAQDTECRVCQAGASSDGKGGKRVWASLLIYKNARIDRAILDETCGKFGWKDEYSYLGDKLFCTISIKSPEGEWISKQDVGTESNTEKEKGQVSDALKRAAFAWGIGTELYTGPRIFVSLLEGEYYEQNGKIVPKVSFGVKQLDVNEDHRITGITIETNPDKPQQHRRDCYQWSSKPSPSGAQIAKIAARIASGDDIVGKTASAYYVTNECWQAILSQVAVMEKNNSQPKSE